MTIEDAPIVAICLYISDEVQREMDSKGRDSSRYPEAMDEVRCVVPGWWESCHTHWYGMPSYPTTTS